MKKLLGFLAVLALVFLSANGFAASLGGVEMADSVDVEGKTLTLRGLGEHKNLLGTVYVAGLYLMTPAKTADEAINADEPKRIQLKFVRTLELGDARRIIRTGFNDNVPEADEELKAKMKSLLEAFNAEFDPRTTLTITYTPGGGTTVEKGYVLSGAKLIGWFGGADFMRALFSVWLGNVPASEEVKRGMMGE
ncbi:hypothetical protein EPN96_11645 [bacterium]|nr:MAG: hypothetical protein EPN96_11645 [bacterium]